GQPARLQRLAFDVELLDVVAVERAVGRREILGLDALGLHPALQLVDAVVDEYQRDVLVERRSDQHHLERLERIDRPVGRLAVHEHELLLLGHRAPQSPKVTRRSASMPASTSWPSPEIRKPGASTSSLMPRRSAAATQTTRSTPCSSASFDHRVTTLRSSCGGSVSRVELFTPSW